jgi:uncharacterized protein YndB with AHSA1/START domain
MGLLVRALKLLIVLFLVAAVVLWFAARRGDRGYISEQVTINRPATTVYRWITTDELLRRWISNLAKLERIPASGAASQSNFVYRIDEMIAKRPVAIKARIVRAIPNQELKLSVRSANEAADGFNGDAELKLLPNGDYTQLIFTLQTNFQSLSDQIFEPILTYATRKKLEEDLTRLKFMIEAESGAQSH